MDDRHQTTHPAPRPASGISRRAAIAAATGLVFAAALGAGFSSQEATARIRRRNRRRNRNNNRSNENSVSIPGQPGEPGDDGDP